MTKPVITFVRTNTRIGMYIGNVLVFQGLSLSVEGVAQFLGFTVAKKNVDTDQPLPRTLREVE